MDVICIEEEAFYSLIEEVVNRLREQHGNKEDRWIDGEEAMRLLRIKSKTTLQNLRDEGKISFSQPSRKIILYDRLSIEEYLVKNTKSIF